MDALSSLGTLAEVDHINPNSTNASRHRCSRLCPASTWETEMKGYSELEVRLCCIVKFYLNKNNSNNLKEQKSYNDH